jgi:serine/threonine protein phosphatase PrpC
MHISDRSNGSTPSRRVELRFDAVGVTDVGRQRKHNEDFVLLRAELDLFVVADGMGGHNAGDVASKLATASLRNFFEAVYAGEVNTTSLPAGYESLSPEGQRLAAAIRKANRDVFEISSTHRQHQGMGSTVVACHFVREHGVFHVGHVGDSRCYRYRKGNLEQLTRDHSLVNDALALKPDLTPEELARLPKNIITRALGMREEVKVDVRSETVQPGDLYLLCSDGLSGLLSDAQMSEVLGEIASNGGTRLRDDCERLVTMANEAGGNDNISALVVRIEAEEIDGSAPGADPQVPGREAESDASIDVDFTDDEDDVLEVHATPVTDVTPPRIHVPRVPGTAGNGPASSPIPVTQPTGMRSMTQEFEVHVDEVTPASRACPSCRAAVGVKHAFCPLCGTALR